MSAEFWFLTPMVALLLGLLALAPLGTQVLARGVVFIDLAVAQAAAAAALWVAAVVATTVVAHHHEYLQQEQHK